MVATHFPTHSQITLCVSDTLLDHSPHSITYSPISPVSPEFIPSPSHYSVPITRFRVSFPKFYLNLTLRARNLSLCNLHTFYTLSTRFLTTPDRSSAPVVIALAQLSYRPTADQPPALIYACRGHELITTPLVYARNSAPAGTRCVPVSPLPHTPHGYRSTRVNPRVW